MDHPYSHKMHCRDCGNQYAREYRRRTGGKAGIRLRKQRREQMRQEVEANPNRYRMARGVYADIETGLIYGALFKPIGSSDTSGYTQIDDGCTEDHRAVGAHIVVWESVYGPLPKGREINHVNGIKTDNRIVNLEAVSHQQNILHAYRTGLKSNQGEKHPTHKLTEVDVREIRHLRGNGWTEIDLSIKYSVSRRTINDVVSKKTWAYVKEGNT